MIRAAITLVALVLLAGCNSSGPGPEPESTTPAGNGYAVQRLFTHDGCTVYRFLAGGYYRYFTRCDGAVSSEVSWVEGCGKNCTRSVSLPTARGKERP